MGTNWARLVADHYSCFATIDISWDKEAESIEWFNSTFRYLVDRAASPNQLNWTVLGRGFDLVWGMTHWGAIREGGKVINCDWINHQACSLSGSFITNDFS